MAQLSEFEQLQLEEQKLKLELMRENVAKIHRDKDTEKRNRSMQAATEARNREIQEANQAACAHKKGGNGPEGIFSGDDSKYSVIKHTEPWGETYVKCQRCGKEVRDPFFMLRKTAPEKVAAYRKKNPDEYKRKMDEYREWLNLPTDNSPSGGTIFGFQREDDAAEDVAA